MDAFSSLFFQAITCKVCVYLQSVVYSSGHFLAYEAAVLVASVSNFSLARVADARTCDFKSPGRVFESATAKVLISRLVFTFSYLHLRR